MTCYNTQRKILEILYKQGRKCSTGVKEELLMQKLEKIGASELKFHVNYLEEKEYILIKSVYDGFTTIEKINITAKGIDLVGNPRL